MFVYEYSLESANVSYTHDEDPKSASKQFMWLLRPKVESSSTTSMMLQVLCTGEVLNMTEKRDAGTM